MGGLLRYEQHSLTGLRRPTMSALQQYYLLNRTLFLGKKVRQRLKQQYGKDECHYAMWNIFAHTSHQ